MTDQERIAALEVEVETLRRIVVALLALAHAESKYQRDMDRSVDLLRAAYDKHVRPEWDLVKQDLDLNKKPPA